MSAASVPDPRFMSFPYLQQTERQTTRAFSHHFASFEAVTADILDTLFRLPYFIRERIEEPADGVHQFVLERFLHFPYSVRAVWMLTRSGLYPESSMLIRHLLEAFVQTRYFVRHPERLVPHFTRGGKERMRFETMFNEFSRGYYDHHYRVLASIAHAGMGLSALTLLEKDAVSDKLLSPIGVKFDADRASFVVNHTQMLMLGYLTCVPDWFARYRELVDPDTEAVRLEHRDLLHRWAVGHYEKFDHGKKWVERSLMLMGVTASASS